MTRGLALVATALLGCADPSACEHGDEPRVELGRPSDGAFVPLREHEVLAIADAPQGGYGVPVRVRTRGLSASNRSTATIEMAMELQGAAAGTFTLQGYPLLCEGADAGGSVGVQVVPLDPARFGTPDAIADLDGEAAVLSVTITDDTGENATATAIVELAS
ncbi:MAG: hypothetical protein K1X88_13100 [Nannocystaceae bacterium]|nr:hypothetical protein [Nannocystaceae bacterium]